MALYAKFKLFILILNIFLATATKKRAAWAALEALAWTNGSGMYFITPKASSNIFLIGVFENLLFGFGKRNRKLYIYQKSIFDVGNWNIFLKINANVMASSLCKCSNGLHIASGIIDSKIWIIGKKSRSKTFVFSIAILSKKTKTYTVNENQNAFISPIISCCKCSMSYVQSYESNPHQFLIAPNHIITNTPYSLRLFAVTFNELKQSCNFDYHGERYIKATVCSNISINESNEILYANQNFTSDGIESFSISNGWRHKEIRNKCKKWKEIIFFCDGNKNYCFTKYFIKNGSIRIGLFTVNFLYEFQRIKFVKEFHFKVGANFPSFKSSTIFASPNFFILQSSQEIVTFPKRILSLSESAYLSLCKFPKLPKSFVQLTFFEKIKRFFQKSQMKSSDPWMSLNFIIDALNLSPSFSLIHLSLDDTSPNLYI